MFLDDVVLLSTGDPCPADANFSEGDAGAPGIDGDIGVDTMDCPATDDDDDMSVVCFGIVDWCACFLFCLNLGNTFHFTTTVTVFSRYMGR